MKFVELLKKQGFNILLLIFIVIAVPKYGMGKYLEGKENLCDQLGGVMVFDPDVNYYYDFDDPEYPSEELTEINGQKSTWKCRLDTTENEIIMDNMKGTIDNSEAYFRGRNT